MQKPSKKEAQDAVKILLSYIEQDVNREGLKETPERVIRSFDELFAGYTQRPEEILSKKFHEVNGYSDAILLRNINFTSICEHHMLPFHGTVDISYIPKDSVIGLSKLARLVEIFARRLQIQERLTCEIASTLQDNLDPKGVAVRVSATHSCMSMRGVSKHNTMMESFHFTGIYKSDIKKAEFMNIVRR